MRKWIIKQLGGYADFPIKANMSNHQLIDYLIFSVSIYGKDTARISDSSGRELLITVERTIPHKAKRATNHS